MKILLTQPNYAWLGKRTWRMHPYSLALLNACLKEEHEVVLFDPNFHNMQEQEVIEYLIKLQPEVIGVSSVSTEYVSVNRRMTAIIKKALPDSIIIQGGIIPTVIPEIAIKDPNVNFWIIGEGEVRLPRLLREFEKPNSDYSNIDGVAYREDGMVKVIPSTGFIQDLNSVPFADYGNLDFLAYGNQNLKFAAGLLPKQSPYAVTITSRGCPYRCIFCAASTVSGKKIRYRSAKNILEEIDFLYKSGIREVIFLDDHFLGNRKRAVEIMKGLIERKYDLTWKCANLYIHSLDAEILRLMKESNSYQMTLSIESGNQYVLDKIIKKPIKLDKVPDILKMIRSFGFETIVNFVIGFPSETWEQIRDTFRFAEQLEVDLVNFHIATPLPKTELMELCIREKCLPEDFWKDEDSSAGYGKGLITTNEVTPFELQVLRAFEWDRINFSSEDKKKIIARMEGITLEELEEWRKQTRHKCGVNVIK